MKEVSTEKTMTVKEVAEVLGVTPEAIKKHVRELFPECIRNGIETVLTVSQVTEIKKKMLPTTLVVGAVTEIDRQKTIILAMQYLKEDYDKMKQRAEIAEQKCIEQKPKVDVYDAISDSSTLQDLQTVAQTIGVKNIFKILLADGIIMKAWTKDKTMFYRPYAQYNDYLVTKDGNPYKVNGVAHVRPRIFVTAKGLLWLTKKYKEGK